MGREVKSHHILGKQAEGEGRKILRRNRKIYYPLIAYLYDGP